MLTQVARSSRHAVAHLDRHILRLRASLAVPPSQQNLPRHQAAQPRANRHFFTASTVHQRRYLISEGRTTGPTNEDSSGEPSIPPSSPFYLEVGYSIFAKRPSRPFPPPFVSAPSGSFSEPLTTHNAPRGRRPYVDGEPVRGITNGDDAIIIGDSNFLAVNDGVGAWAQKDRGHAALWSRLIAHFWATEVEKSFAGGKDVDLADLNPIQNLQVAYDLTNAATKGSLEEDGKESGGGEEGEGKKEDEKKGEQQPRPKATTSSEGKDHKGGENDILGTTTASSALLHHKDPSTPVILATTLGDCKVLIVRPANKSVIYRSKEQWHWFDCPRQLGTNSPDTPLGNAVTDTVDVELGDVVAVLSDGVTDNLWEHEICDTICGCVDKWAEGKEEAKDGVVYVARTLMNAAREIAQDPNAESPYMERAFDEGIAAEGGKLDDISVVLGVCRKRD